MSRNDEQLNLEPKYKENVFTFDNYNKCRTQEINFKSIKDEWTDATNKEA